MNRRWTAVASLVVILALVLALPAGVVAKGKPVGEATNNLSAPTILVGGGGFTGVTCGTPTAPSELVYPTGDPRTGYEIDPTLYWYVQGVHKWQAQCYTDTSASAAAAWGDNLTGDAKLKIGKPIRVELGLEGANPDGLDGFLVQKLEPSMLDRESKYGTLAETFDGGLTYEAVADAYTLLRVYDGGATFSIRNVATGAYVVQPGTTARGEINATGKVVYGYQLKVLARGEYEITYVLPNVTLTGTDGGTYDPAAHTVTLIITVV